MSRPAHAHERAGQGEGKAVGGEHEAALPRLEEPLVGQGGADKGFLRLAGRVAGPPRPRW